MNFWELLSKNPDLAGGLLLLALTTVVAIAIVLYKLAESLGERGRCQRRHVSDD